MKRIVLMLTILAAMTIGAHAQNYVVQEVTGRVERDGGGGRWTAVTVGETLSANTVIRTLMGASLTLRSGDAVITIGAMRNGALSALLNSNATIQIQGGVTQTDTGSAARTAGRVGTASARAGEAGEEDEN